jgi:hypothetical protein
MIRRRLRRRPHPQLHLPSLEAHEALLLVAVCERIISAVWRAHGDAMANVTAYHLPLEPVPPAPDAQPETVATGDDDEIF